ncbi:MAG: MFS transporter [Planctomycetaceae bacterium]|nr:MFS transporter [Planctomycetaceae bacterium]
MTPALRRKLLFAALYFSEGAPIGFLWWALPTRLASAGVETADITALTAALVLPWTFKFLWAPTIDALQFPRWTLRHWITLCQILMGLALVPLMFLNLADDFGLIRFFLIAHAVFAATQDVAIDAFCISMTEPEERGAYNGWMQAGMLVGRSILGGGALILFSHFGQTTVLSMLLLAIFSSGILLWTLPLGRPIPVKHRHSTLAGTFREVFLSLKLAFEERATWWAVLFALTAAAAFEALGAVQGPFLRQHQMSEATIGWLMAVPYVIALAVGSLLGGYLADRIGHRKLVAGSLIGFVVCVSVAGGLMISNPPDVQSLSILIVANGFCIGIFTASTYAMFMNLSHPSVAGTQFSALMGATNGCEAWSAWSIGAISLQMPIGQGLWCLAVVSILSLIFLRQLPGTRSA